jgi:hypothetical protein
MKGKTMKDKPVLREIESPVQYRQLAPGMYTANCLEKLDPETTAELMLCSGLSSAEVIYNGTFLGMLMPYYLHNTNNLMVGVMGNLDLADIFMPDLEKVGPKLEAARGATGRVVDFLRSVSGAFPSEDCTSVTGDEIRKTLTIIRTACGRSVCSEGLDSIDISDTFPCKDPAKAIAAMNGIAAWLVVSLGGMGSVSGVAIDGRLTFKWTRPEGSGKSHMPGSGNGNIILSLAGGLAASAGLALVAENLTKNGGEVSIVFNK